MKSFYYRKLCSLSRSQSRIMLHVNSRETTVEHQPVPAARFNNIFLKLFNRHATYCYLQVDLKSFLASGAFFLGREATKRATIRQVNKFQTFLAFCCFLTVTQQRQETNTSKSPGWATQTIFSVARGQVLRRIKSTALGLRPPLHGDLTFPSFADAVSFFGLCNPA